LTEVTADGVAITVVSRFLDALLFIADQSFDTAQGYAPSPQRPRPGMGGYYRNNSYGFRQDSFVEESRGPLQQQHQNRGHMRYMSSPSYYNQAPETPSPAHSNEPSYETTTSGSEDYGKSTNPSSQNSSFDRLNQLRKPEEYQQEILSEYGAHFAPINTPQPLAPWNNNEQNQIGTFGHQNERSNQNGSFSHAQRRNPIQPPKVGGPSNPRVPTKLSSGTGGAPEADYGQKSGPTKRSSWLKRAFSKRGR
jgi:hypothetical protein